MRDTTVACSLGQQDLAERQARWSALAADADLEIAPTENGLRLLFRERPGVAEELHELVALERECCAFADWSLKTAIVLDVSGESAEEITAVQAMFTGLRRTGA
jgi:hypothetical protein